VERKRNPSCDLRSQLKQRRHLSHLQRTRKHRAVDEAREGARDRTISTLPPAAWIRPEAFLGNEALDGLERLNVGYSIHQQHTKKKDQIEHGKHEQATRRLPFLVIAPTYLP
jgi:hypothetical protein